MFKDKANKPDETVERAKKALEQCVSLSNSTIKRFTIFTNSKANKKFDIDQYLNILKDIYPRVNMEHAEMPAVITAHTGPNYFVFGVDLE
jgi:fatty acid-binding protein DegV